MPAACCLSGRRSAILSNKEVKVGFVVFVALVFLSLLVSVAGGLRWRHRGFDLWVLFPDVRGLEAGGAVFVSGVERGRVDTIELSPDGVRVKLSLVPDVILPVDSRFVIDSGGLLGESRINITRGKLEERLQDGAEVQGEVPPSFDEVIGRFEKDLSEIRRTFSHVNAILGDEEVQRGLRSSAQSLPLLLEEGRSMLEMIGRAAEAYTQLAADIGSEVGSIGEEARDLSGSLRAVISGNEESLRSALSSLDSFMARLDRVLADFDADGTSGEALRRTVGDLSRAAQEIEKLAHDLGEELMAPSGTGGEASTVRSLRSAATKADKLLSSVESFRFGGVVGLHQAYSGFDDGTRLVDLDLNFYRENSPWRFSLAVEDVGGADQFSAAVDYPLLKGVDLSAGLIRGEPGGGVLFRLQEWGLPFSLRWRWWDEDGGAWSSEEWLHLNDQWGIFHRRVECSDEGRDSVGLFYRF